MVKVAFICFPWQLLVIGQGLVRWMTWFLFLEPNNEKQINKSEFFNKCVHIFKKKSIFFPLQNNGSFFSESDIALFEAFAIFCGIGIHNTKMYEGAIKMMAKQKVALDCLSYHASASCEDTEDLAKANVPDAETYSLYRYVVICQTNSYFLTEWEFQHVWVFFVNEY